jgi:hypothetical protein
MVLRGIIAVARLTLLLFSPCFGMRHIPCSRRGFVTASALSLAFPDDNNGDTDLLSRCRNGALSMEQAVPGAYQQECMYIPTREIPVQLANGKSVILKLDQQVAAAGSTGMAVWNSSVLMKRLLERLSKLEPGFLQRKKVFELGCGCALASMTVAVVGAESVIATDGNPRVVELARRNVETNQLEDRVTVEQLQWGMMDAMELAGMGDVVLGADLTYSPGSWRQLAESMETILCDHGYVLYLSLGHAGFNVNAEVEGFLSVAQQTGLESIQPSHPNWPFPKIKTDLSDILTRSILTNEFSVLQATGGVKVIVLQKKQRHDYKRVS